MDQTRRLCWPTSRSCGVTELGRNKHKRKKKNVFHIVNKSREGPAGLEYNIKEGNLVDILGNEFTLFFTALNAIKPIGPFSRGKVG